MRTYLSNRHGACRLLSTLLVCLLAMLWLLPTAGAASADTAAKVYDPTDLIPADVEQALSDHLIALEQEHGVALYMATYEAKNYRDDFTGTEYCHTIHNLNGTDAVLLIVTYDHSDGIYYYDLYTYGKANQRLTNTEVDYILDHDSVYDNLKGGRLAAGAEAFFDLSAKGYTGRVGVSMAIIIAVCAVISLIIALIVCGSVVSAYRRKHPSVEYPLDRYATLNLTSHEDRFLHKSVTRVHVPRNNGSGGRGGGSRHGGGGGHRGGR